MALRRPPRVFEDRSADRDSDIDIDPDLGRIGEEEAAVYRAMKKQDDVFPQTSPNRPTFHPVLTDFGPDSLQTFLRMKLEEVKQEGQDFSNRKGKKNAGTDLPPVKAPRPGFQRPLQQLPTTGWGKKPGNGYPDRRAYGPFVQEDEETQRPTLRRSSRRTARLVDSDDSDDPSSRRQPVPRPPLDEFMQQAAADRRSGKAARDAMGEINTRRSTRLKANHETTCRDDVPLKHTKTNDIANISDKPREAPADAVLTVTSGHPQALTAFEAFQEDKLAHFGMFRDNDGDDIDPTPRRGSCARRSSRNIDFEEHVNAKRQSWREDEESSRDRQPSNSADVDDDSPRARKPPSRFDAFSPSFENAPARPSAHTIASSSHAAPQVTTSDLAAAVEGLWDDVSVLAPSSQSPPLPAIPERSFVDQFRAVVDDAHIVHAQRNEDGDMLRDLAEESHEPISLLDPSDNDSNSLSSQALASYSLEASGRAFPKFVTASPAPIVNDGLPAFDYAQVVPETLPKEIGRPAPKGLPARKSSRAEPSGLTNRSSVRQSTRKSAIVEDQSLGNESLLQHPRVWDATDLPSHPKDPPQCRPNRTGSGWPENLSSEMFANICEFLSHEDVRNLRLVNQSFADVTTPILFRSVVTKFGKSMFDINGTNWDSATGFPPSNSLFKQLGAHINKFGICFEVDSNGLHSARSKVIQRQEESWFGDYPWPLPEYPRFAALKSIEDLVDDNAPHLRNALSHLSRTSELALSIDSGHGWLNGPDLSDLAIYNMRCAAGSKVFDKTFKGENKWHTHGRSEFFKWAQQNTLNEATKAMHQDQENGRDRRNALSFLKSVVVRGYDSFKDEAAQPDREAFAHIGGRNTHPPHNPPQPYAGPAILAHAQNLAQPLNPQQLQMLNNALQQQQDAGPNHLNAQLGRRAPRELRRRPFKRGGRTSPQWPVIFNGHNIAAEVGGQCPVIQSKIAPPQVFPLCPGNLTEAQAQWLMETVWAQRAFLSAYTTSMIMNKANLRGVHSLHIAKLSSGLLPSLSQREFWSALPALKTLKILISPDWRTEHTPGDKAFNVNMLVSPIHASTKFAEFLHQYIARIENLSSLTVGFVGGGEHAPGIFARNQNILPAPVTNSSRTWLSDHKEKADLDTMMKFDHIRELKFENCWFSPCMLETFMAKSRDTSLRHLILDSVSLTGVNSERQDGPLSTLVNNLRTHHGREAWLHERLPDDGGWPSVLDRLTPGVTFLERKIEAGMIEEHEIDKPENKREFRGNIERITLKSCGYAKISGVTVGEFNQNGVVVNSGDPMDAGLKFRKTLLESGASPAEGESDEGNRRRYGHIRTWQIPAPRLNGLFTTTNNQAQAAGGARGGNVTAHQQNARIVPSERETALPVGARVMMGHNDPVTGSEYVGLGKLTQCVHPVEKRVLEQAWGLKFGWGDNMERWAAVEDGWFEGGTGRFSGVVARQDA